MAMTATLEPSEAGAIMPTTLTKESADIWYIRIWDTPAPRRHGGFAQEPRHLLEGHGENFSNYDVRGAMKRKQQGHAEQAHIDRRGASIRWYLSGTNHSVDAGAL